MKKLNVTPDEASLLAILAQEQRYGVLWKKIVTELQSDLEKLSVQSLRLAMFLFDQQPPKGDPATVSELKAVEELRSWAANLGRYK